MIIQTHMHLPVSFCRQLLPCRERHKFGDLLVFVQLLQRVEPLGEAQSYGSIGTNSRRTDAEIHV